MMMEYQSLPGWGDRFAFRPNLNKADTITVHKLTGAGNPQYGKKHCYVAGEPVAIAEPRPHINNAAVARIRRGTDTKFPCAAISGFRVAQPVHSIPRKELRFNPRSYDYRRFTLAGRVWVPRLTDVVILRGSLAWVARTPEPACDCCTLPLTGASYPLYGVGVEHTPRWQFCLPCLQRWGNYAERFGIPANVCEPGGEQVK